ncbi:hypothetical protein HHX47_DHR8000106 [Lentinula edodes]|nr:hypothetical protein HHX47_DHR8000106 [Lentinula edodes]
MTGILINAQGSPFYWQNPDKDCDYFPAFNDSMDSGMIKMQIQINDSAVISASNQALSGLHTSQGGVATIVKGVLAGVTPDDTGVPAIANGLATVAQALSSINSDNSTQTAAQAAIAALTSAGGVVTNVQDVASAANIVGQSIVVAQDLLNLINSTDSSVISALDSAQLDMIGMLFAGQNLAIDCTPTAGGVAPGKRRRGLGAFILGY